MARNLAHVAWSPLLQHWRRTKKSSAAASPEKFAKPNRVFCYARGCSLLKKYIHIRPRRWTVSPTTV
jgi:hypothetical protein